MYFGSHQSPLLVPHYPSWGSETWRKSQVERGTARLITPHGDRKPTQGKPITACPYSLITLMGIGNGSSSRRWEREFLTLITPHGDRKPPAELGDSDRLMTLITPHGDRKPLPPTFMVTPLHPHYPSWGSETPAGVVFSFQLCRYSSLPLMGIGSVAGPGRGKARLHLITPHGDRKPEPRPAWWSRHRRPHYPSWGSETLDYRGRVAGRAHSHYPSWGSETSV